jgi:hypothetical protein
VSLANPIRRVGNGCYRYGSHGKVYCGRDARAKAARQGRAIEWRRHGSPNPSGDMTSTEVILISLAGIAAFTAIVAYANMQKSSGVTLSVGPSGSAPSS